MRCFSQICFLVGCALIVVNTATVAAADDKTVALTEKQTTAANQPAVPYQLPSTSKQAKRSLIQQHGVELPLIIVRGTPYEMGFQLGESLRKEINTFIPAALQGVCAELDVSVDTLQEAWARSAAYADDRVEQELAGLADGSGVPLKTLQAMHAVPLLMPYSCSSIAAWGKATRDGHLYQTRNLDWSMEIGAHNFAVVVVYVPDEGHPHVIPTFAGFIGAHTGMNLQGIALAEMGDASRKEAPYFVHAPHFTVYFRTLLYDADSLTETLDIFAKQPLTKRYHFVFGDGRNEKRAIKIVAHAPEPAGQQVRIMNDNDPQDEFAPQVLSCVVYNDEGRGAFPTLQQQHGEIDGEKLVALANKIPIKGGNVVNVVYDATDLRMWVTYAQGNTEAYLRPSVLIDLKELDLTTETELVDK